MIYLLALGAAVGYLVTPTVAGALTGAAATMVAVAALYVLCVLVAVAVGVVREAKG